MIAELDQEERREDDDHARVASDREQAAKGIGTRQREIAPVLRLQCFREHEITPDRDHEDETARGDEGEADPILTQQTA